jgi:hypothetical protein
MTAKALWAELASAHNGPLQRARQCSALTIPSVLPPDGSTDSSQLQTPYQSLGARGTNNIASRLMLSLFPPGSAPFRYAIVEESIADAAVPAEERAEVEKQLASREARVMENIESSPQRPVLSEALLHLVITGNGLLFYESLDEIRFYRLDQFRIRRTGGGRPLDAVVAEKVHPSTLSEQVKVACEVKPDEKNDVEVYTQIEWRNGRQRYWQEINGKVVPGSEGASPAASAAWIPLRWKAVPGSHYGRSHVEELLGDLISLEGLSQAIVQFATVAAKILFLKHPSSTTSMEDINNAESGDCVIGNKADIDVLQLEKYADFQVVEKAIERIEARLAHAFLLRSGATRDAERVTAEEIRAVAQELEDVVGGVYTVQAQEFQLPWVNRTLTVLQKARRIPPLPPGVVKPMIVTGFQALGRNHSLNKVRGFVSDLTNIFGPAGVLQIIKAPNLAKRLGVGWGVEELDDLVKTMDEINQENEDAAQQQLGADIISKSAGPAVSAMVKQ